MNEKQGLAVGDIIKYQGAIGLIVRENDKAYFVRWLNPCHQTVYDYAKAYHSRSFKKVS